MLSTVGLKNTYKTSQKFGDGGALAAELLKYGDATAYIVINFSQGAHAMGARLTSTTCDFFDPNVGLLREDTQDAFKSAMTGSMKDYSGWTGNNTHIWTLSGS
jgi:hypothetical protein